VLQCLQVLESMALDMAVKAMVSAVPLASSCKRCPSRRFTALDGMQCM
jgi:hypothetical protein